MEPTKPRNMIDTRRPAAAPEQPRPKPRSKRLRGWLKRRPTWLLPVFVVLLIAAVPSYYFYNQAQNLKNPDTATAQEISKLTSKIGRHLLLPEGETPTLATVSDKSKVSGQPFFQRAENGDKVLVYTQARKAVLYRPSQDKVIEVAPLSVGGSTSTGTTGR